MILRIVDRPEMTASILADLSDLSSPVRLLRGEGLDLGKPDAEFSGVEWDRGTRTVTLPLGVWGTQQEVSQAVARIGRALATRGAWLMWQREGVSAPSWFRMEPQAASAIDYRWVRHKAEGSVWMWPLKVEVDAFPVSQRTTLRPVGSPTDTATVPNSGTARGVLVRGLGEVTSPLRVDMKPSMDWPGRRTLVAAFSVPEGSPLVSGTSPAIARPADAYTAQGDATKPYGGSWSSSSRVIAVPLSNTSARTVMVGTGGWTPPPGRYRMFVRLHRTGALGTATIRFGVRYFATAWQRPVTWKPTGGGDRSSWLEVGVLQHPYGQSPEGLRVGDVAPSDIAIEVTGDGSGNTLNIDGLAYVPAELVEGTATSQTHSWGGVTAPSTVAAMRVDGQVRRVNLVDGGGKVVGSPQPLTLGGFPVAAPGMVTGVVVLGDTSTAPTGLDSTAMTMSLTVSQQPRHVHLAGV